MNTVEPSPWSCIKCNKPAITYADGAVWCNTCEKKLGDNEKQDISRGRQRNKLAPPWTTIELK